MAKQVRVLSIAVTVTRTAQESREQAEGSSMEDDDLHRSMWCLYFQLGVRSSTPRTGTGLHLHGCFTNSSTSFSLWLLLLSRASLDIYLNFFFYEKEWQGFVHLLGQERGGERRERNLHGVGEGRVSSRQFSFRRGASHSAAAPWHYPTAAGTEAPTTQAVMLNKPDACPLLSAMKQHEFLSRRDLPLTSHKTIVVFCEEERNDNQS